MPARATTSSPTPILHTDESGAHSAPAGLVPPVSGQDYGIPVHADLGSAVIPVSQTLQGAANLATSQTATNAVTATLIVAARPTRRSALVTNTSTSISVYIGNSGVTSTTGQLLIAGAACTFPVNCALYAISASSTPTVCVSEAYD